MLRVPKIANAGTVIQRRKVRLAAELHKKSYPWRLTYAFHSKHQNSRALSRFRL
jgi:hypothetical protein